MTHKLEYSIKSILSIALMAVASVSCSTDEVPEVADDTASNEHFMTVNEDQQKMAGITFGPITKQDVEQTLSCSGAIDVPPSNRVSMTTVYGGYITYTDVYPGDQVKKGQLLARLQDPMYIDLQREYLEGLSKLEFLEADYQRKNELQKTQSVSNKQFQQAKQDLETVKVGVDALAAQLKMVGFSTDKLKADGVQGEVEVHSPINGFITGVKVNQGMHLDPGGVLFELIDPSHVHIELNVYPNDLEKLAVGQTVYYRIAGSDDVKKGVIKLINKAVTAENRSILVHVHPDEEDKGLLPGTFVQAQIVVSTELAMVLPLGAVNRIDNAYVAYKKVDKGVEAIYFMPRFATDKYVDASTLEPGNYVLTGAEKLISLDDGGE